MEMFRNEFIENHKNLFWYTPENQKHNISDSLLLETILNYGTLDDVRQLINIFGIDYAADIFFAATGREKQNYYPEIRNFFTLVFNRYAHRNSK